MGSIIKSNDFSIPHPSTQSALSAIQNESSKEQFLQMLVAQISNQDPLDPMDNKDLVAQLAQFTSVEQEIETNRHLENLEEMFAAKDKISISGIIGKHVTADSNNFYADGNGFPAPIPLNLENNAEKVKISLINSAGRSIREINLDKINQGTQFIEWNGRNDAGYPLPKGDYQIKVEAVDDSGKSINCSNKISGVVTGIEFNGKDPAMIINGAKIKSSHIVSINNVSL